MFSKSTMTLTGIKSLLKMKDKRLVQIILLRGYRNDRLVLDNNRFAFGKCRMERKKGIILQSVVPWTHKVPNK